MGIVKDFISGIYNLLLGLKVTSKRLPEKAVTLQYPEERWEMPERSRGIVVLLSDKETGELNCTACMLCMRACPTAAIQIERDKNENNKWYAKSFTVDNTICCFCGLCEDACNFDAIKLATKYEHSVYDQSELVWDIRRLQEMGRDVPYTPKRVKKKSAAAKKTAATPSQKPAPKPVEGAEQKAQEKAAPTEKPQHEQAATERMESRKGELKNKPDDKPAENSEQKSEEKKEPEKPDDKPGVEKKPESTESIESDRETPKAAGEDKGEDKSDDSSEKSEQDDKKDGK